MNRYIIGTELGGARGVTADTKFLAYNQEHQSVLSIYTVAQVAVSSGFLPLLAITYIKRRITTRTDTTPSMSYPANSSLGIHIIIDPLSADRYIIRHRSLGSSVVPQTLDVQGVQVHASSVVFKLDLQGNLSVGIYISKRDPLTSSGWAGHSQSTITDFASLPAVGDAFSDKDIIDWSPALSIVETDIREKLLQAGYEIFDNGEQPRSVACPNGILLSGKQSLIAILSEQIVVLRNPRLILTAATTWDEVDGRWGRDVHVAWLPYDTYDESKYEKRLQGRESGARQAKKT